MLMFSRLVARLALAGLLLLAVVSLRYAYVDAGVLTASADMLVPSSQAALLGAINEDGRTGWLCRPEQAAASKNAMSAELPLGLRR
jgi:hypothetical protein